MAKRQYAHVRSDLLVWARRSLRMGLEEAAERLRVPPDRLAAWESGEQKPTINQLRNVARVYRRPLAAFFLPGPPKDFYVPHDFRTVPGQPEGPLSPELLQAIRLAQYRRHLAIELIEEQSEAPGDWVGSTDLTDNADAVAARAREALGMELQRQKASRTQYDALNAWRAAAEKLGILVFHFSSVEVEEARGFSLAEMPFPIIALNGKDSPNGRTFSLLHEFAHLLLGRPGISDQREYRGRHSPNQRTEVFCNRVAGATLVPADDLRQVPVVRLAGRRKLWTDDDLHDLARQYGVSREVVLRRLLAIGKTNERFYQEKRVEWARLGERGRTGGFLTVPTKAMRDAGRPFLRIILNAYYRQAITSSDVSEYIGVRLKHLPAIERKLFGPGVLAEGNR